MTGLSIEAPDGSMWAESDELLLRAEFGQRFRGSSRRRAARASGGFRRGGFGAGEARVSSTTGGRELGQMAPFPLKAFSGKVESVPSENDSQVNAAISGAGAICRGPTQAMPPSCGVLTGRLR